MNPRRLHILAASGTGTSTLGRAVSDAWSVPFHDTDDYFRQPTEPPYITRRPVADQLTLMEQMFLPRRSWVLSGSLMGWGEPVLPKADLVVFLTLHPQIRRGRLRQREAARYGAASLSPGEAYHAGYTTFMAWAAGCDDPDFAGRNLKRHREWLAQLDRPVLERDSNLPVPRLLASVLAA